MRTRTYADPGLTAIDDRRLIENCVHSVPVRNVRVLSSHMSEFAISRRSSIVVSPGSAVILNLRLAEDCSDRELHRCDASPRSNAREYPDPQPVESPLLFANRE